MKKLAAALKQKLENASKIAVLGVGSQLRGDDVAGILAAQQIEKGRRKISSPQIEVFIGNTAPENLTSQIKKFNPSHLLIIDSADINASPGQMSIIQPQDIAGNTFSTHSLPLKLMVDYLLFSLPDLKVVVIGIQPQNIDMGKNVSKEVIRAIKEFVILFNNLFKL
jgi:hydrogenase 3 maturation protease